jgi:hypothetical protein
MNDERRTTNVFRDDRGQSALEGVLAAMVLVGMFLACFFLTQWGTGMQDAQMGARLMAFGAGDTTLAKLNNPRNEVSQLSINQDWDSVITAIQTGWHGHRIRDLFTLTNSATTGSVTGTAKGRLPGQSKLLSYPAAAMGYYSPDWAAAYNPWQSPSYLVRRRFMHIAYYEGLTLTDTNSLDSTSGQTIPHGDTVLQTIYGLMGAIP